MKHFDYLESFKRQNDGLKFGYTELDNKARLNNSALTVIAGSPGHGKTTFMINVLLNCLEQYPDKTFVFVSYKQTKTDIATKILSILSNTIVNENNKDRNLSELKNYYRKMQDGNNSIFKQSLDKFNELLKTNRLILMDDDTDIDCLVSRVLEINAKHDLGAVFIDYVQIIKTLDSKQIRYLEIKSICETLRQVAKRIEKPIVVGSQLNKQGDAREAKDIENEANTILKLSKQDMKEDNFIYNDQTVLTIEIAKNRDGQTCKGIDLIYNNPIQIIKNYPTMKIEYREPETELTKLKHSTSSNFVDYIDSLFKEKKEIQWKIGKNELYNNFIGHFNENPNKFSPQKFTKFLDVYCQTKGIEKDEISTSRNRKKMRIVSFFQRS